MSGISMKIKQISLKKAHNKIKRDLDKFLSIDLNLKSKEQINELFTRIENLGFIKGLAMALFDNPSNIIEKIKDLEN